MFRSMGFSAVGALRGNRVAIIVLAERELSREEIDFFKEKMEEKFDGLKLRMGIGRRYPDPKGVSHSYREALEALEKGRSLWKLGDNRFL
ncbi:MAG: hypothetical protein J7M13_08240 [Synergistetes bacterium]|nr:hypothetical protein [Synergistota bacterium]